jgi:hypothetical protein
VLYFVSTELSLCYLLFAFLSALGALQAVAARYRIDGLAFVDNSDHPWRGYVLGAALALAGALIFFVTQWAMIFMPGPAGAELTILFGAAALAALLATFLLASLTRRRRTSSPGAALRDGHAVTVGRSKAHLYIPSESTAPMAAVCLLPGFADGTLTALAHRLSRQGFVALALEFDPQAYAPPAIHEIAPAAVELLASLPLVDAQRMGFLGHDLGGDLAIRAAASDTRIRAIAAMAPVLEQTTPGLSLLQEMPFLSAVHWLTDRQRVATCKELSAREHASAIAPRPLLLVHGEWDVMVANTSASELNAQRMDIPAARHVDLPDNATAQQTVAQWFKEHL